MDMQRIISKHQHTDGLIALFPQHQMSGDISYDFGPYQGHGTLHNCLSRHDDHTVSKGHFMNATGYSYKASSYNNILTPELIASFDGNCGSAIVFCKTSVWGNFMEQWALRLESSDGHEIEFSKRVNPGDFRIRYDPGSGHSQIVYPGTNDWFSVGMSWNNEAADDDPADECLIYLNGVREDRLVTFPLWTGDLELAIIGAETAEPAGTWDGSLGIVALYNVVLTEAQMLYLSKP